MKYLYLTLLLMYALGFIVAPFCWQYRSNKNIFISNKKTTIILATTIAVASILLYVQFGSLSKVHHWEKITERADKLKDEIAKTGNLDLVIHKIQEGIDDEPNDPLGWYLLGRVHYLNKDFSLSVSAFEKAHQLDVDNNQIKLQYAQSLFFLDRKENSTTINELLQDVLADDPLNMLASNITAMSAFQDEHYQKAIHHWRQILIHPGLSNEDRKSIQNAIKKAQELKEHS